MSELYGLAFRHFSLFFPHRTRFNDSTNMRHHFLTILLALSFVMEIISARAAITVVSYWRLGEQDPADVASHYGPSTTTDAVGTNNLTISGATGYALTSSPAALAHTASAYS